MTDDLIEDFLDTEFSAKTSGPPITWREYFRQMCLGHLPLIKAGPREDWYDIDPITHEQYPEVWIAQDLCFIEPMIEHVDGKSLYEIDELTDEIFSKSEINWELAAQTLTKVVDYLFRKQA